MENKSCEKRAECEVVMGSDICLKCKYGQGKEDNFLPPTPPPSELVKLEATCLEYSERCSTRKCFLKELGECDAFGTIPVKVHPKELNNKGYVKLDEVEIDRDLLGKTIVDWIIRRINTVSLPDEIISKNPLRLKQSDKTKGDSHEQGVGE